MPSTEFHVPTIAFAPLPPTPTPPTGSCTYTHAGYSVLASASGPLEASRRDLLPESAVLEVNLRPSSGPGGPRERHIEGTLHGVLKPLLDLNAHPRCVIQITLQVLRTPAEATGTAGSYQQQQHGGGFVPELPALMNAAVCALLDGNVAMVGVAMGVVVGSYEGLERDNDSDADDPDVTMEEEHAYRVVILSNEKQVEEARRTGAGMHAFAFTGKGEMLLAESEGIFGFEAWENAAKAAKMICCGEKGARKDCLIEWLRAQIGGELAKRRRWRE